VTQAEWEAGKQQRISNWYKDIIATSSTSQLALNATSLTCPVLDLWYDTDKGSWPAGLESLWENISNSSIRAIVDNVRSHYADDQKLGRVADWLDFWERRKVLVKHTVRAESVLPPLAKTKYLDFAAQHPGCKRWLQVRYPSDLNSQVQLSKRVTTQQWQSQQNERINQWYEDLVAEHDGMPVSHPILDSWLDSDRDSWPAGLERFWNQLCAPYDIESMVRYLRSSYAEDSDLLSVAEWIEFWDSKGMKIDCSKRK
jgi:hypothetical protein